MCRLRAENIVVESSERCQPDRKTLSDELCLTWGIGDRYTESGKLYKARSRLYRSQAIFASRYSALALSADKVDPTATTRARCSRDGASISAASSASIAKHDFVGENHEKTTTFKIWNARRDQSR